ncbi:MAG: fructose-6-phosphate aldolase [Solirubrobacteraceae bacterium]|nr:fructose-6-phosphate aldolase [Solirubrobacteraceae bacterium]
MKIFIDSANIDEIREANEWGIIDGVTTNPSLIAREKKDIKQLIWEITEINKPVSVEGSSKEADGLIKEAGEIAGWGRNIVVKIPMTPEGIKAVTILKNYHNIKTNMTLVFSVNQALLAAMAGATYVSLFVGRLDDTGVDGMQVVEDIIKIFNHYHLKSEVIVASIRTPQHVTEAAIAGAHVATVPFKILEQMFNHPLTDAGIKKFTKDWEEIEKCAKK